MALNVGELTGTITLDPSGVADGLRDAERQMQRSGQQMGDDAGRAGQQAGQQLGEGVTRGADGRLRTLNGRFVRAGQQAGQGLGDGVRRAAPDVGDAAGAAGDTGGESFMQRMRGRASAGIGDMTSNLREGIAGKLGLAAVGAAAGAMLMQGMSEAMDQSRITGRLGAQLGATGPEMQRYGHIAGSMYADAVTEDFQGAADAIGAIMSAGIAPPGATEAQLESLSTKVSDLASTFELDLGQTANAVGQIMKTHLAKDGGEALDVLARGMQVMGPRADDLMDTFNEYSTIFRSMGLSAQTATGLLSQGMKAGARDTDVVADALKEFQIRATDGSTASAAGFKALGLSATDMTAQISKGGAGASDGLQTVLDKLRNMKDPVQRNAAAVALFGTKAEDMGKALYALDPSKATDALGKVGGAADRMGDSLRDNAGTKVEAFKRGIQQGVVDFLGTTVIPAITNAKTLIGGAFGSMWAEAGKGGQQGLDQVLSFFGLLGPKLVEKVKALGPQAIQGLMTLGQDIGTWMIANPDKLFKIALIANAIIIGLAALPLLVGAALIAAIGLIVVNIGRSLVEGIPAQLGKLGGVIGGWFGGLWSRYIATPVSQSFGMLISYVGGLPGRAVQALAILGAALAQVASRAWQDFKSSAQSKGSDFLAWVRGLPGRASSALGNLGNLLHDKGADLVRGLVRGVQSMGGWLRDQLMSFAKGMIPGPIAKALGISSPSRLMADKIGRWIPAGIAQGIEQHSGVLDSTMSSLVDTPTPSAAMASSMSSAGAGSGASGGSGSVARVSFGNSAFDEFVVERIRQAVGNRGGNVQLVLGKG